jgi:hypothetical protein
MNSGSSEASREEGIESDREGEAYITTTSACGLKNSDDWTVRLDRYGTTFEDTS